MIHRTGLYMTKLIFAVFLAVLVITATAFGETNLDVEIKEANNMNDDMVLAADYLTDRIKSACKEKPEIISLQIDLGLFYTYRVQGVTERGTVMLIYDTDTDDDYDGTNVLDHAWVNHLKERTYYSDFEALVTAKLKEKQCPPYEFKQPIGQKKKLLQIRESLWNVIGEKTEISEVLEAILPLWSKIGQDQYDPYLNEAGINEWTAGKPFTITWTYQESDEESDEYYQLTVELTYPPDEENRKIREEDWLDGNDDFRSAVRGTKAYQWAEGKQAARVSVYIDGT